MILNMHTVNSDITAGKVHASNRIGEVLYHYWDNLRGDRAFPAESEIDPDEISDIWNSCFLVNISPAEVNNHGYRYTYLGTALIDAFGSDITGQEVSARLIDSASKTMVRQFDQAVKTAKPVYDEAEFTNSKKLLIKYRSCILPLGGKLNPDYLIGGMKWKAF